MKRIFVVGCPRSGTTVVQALLARYRGVLTLPETAFFESVYGDSGQRWQDPDARHAPWYRMHGFARSNGQKRLCKLETDLLGSTQAAPWRIDACIRRFVDLLDRVADAQGCDMWLEKTPSHVLYLDEVAQHVAGAHFIHVLRNGEDVVASAVDADLNHPTHAFHGGVKHWTRRWNRIMELQLACLGEARHHMLCLEDMVEDFDQQWAALCAFLDVDPSLPLASSPHAAIADVGAEPWKRNALTGVVGSPAPKSEKLFGPHMLEWLRSNLLPYGEVRSLVAHVQKQGACRPAGRRYSRPQAQAPGRDRALAS